MLVAGSLQGRDSTIQIGCLGGSVTGRHRVKDAR